MPRRAAEAPPVPKLPSSIPDLARASPSAAWRPSRGAAEPRSAFNNFSDLKKMRRWRSAAEKENHLFFRSSVWRGDK